MSDNHEWQRPIAVLAADLERVTRRVEDAAGKAVKASEIAVDAHKVISVLSKQIEGIARARTTPPDQAEPVPVVSWMTVSDPGEAHRLLQRLIEWLGTVYLRYPDASKIKGCWLWHANVVEELLTLHQAWYAAYVSTEATIARAVDWQDRARPGVVRRITKALSGCSLQQHKPSGPADVLPPRVPAADAAENIASWWATTHGRTAAPSPTPAQLADETARRRDDFD